MSRELLPQSWFARDTVAVACDLLGRYIRCGRVTLRITETEAYLGPHDSACHTSMGRTARNAPMWGPPGHAYVYLCYGLHHMLNVVTGDGAAVLVRAAEPVTGIKLILQRRGGLASLAGPGKVGQALALGTGLSGHALYQRGGLMLLAGVIPKRIVTGPRIGIEYAETSDRTALLRFADADSASVTYRKGLA